MRNVLQIDAVDNMVFDGLQAVCWIIALNIDLTAARVRNISPGQLYTFIIRQGNQGNTFVWPSACVNAIPVDRNPHSTTIQNFIGDTGGILRAHLPGTWEG
jgi:hypothetical protein